MSNLKLRPLNFEPVTHQGQPMWLVIDPLRLSDRQLLVPQALGALLALCDGTRTVTELQAQFSAHVGEAVDLAVIEEVLSQFDQAYLLENGRFHQARLKLLDEYRTQPHRSPALADLSYPGKPQELTRLFHHYGAGDSLNGWQPWHGRGIISPHIDYFRGGKVYAQVWRRAAAAVREADLVLMFGTDHHGGYGTVTLTRQAYATPYGVLPTHLPLINKLAEAIGPEAAFAEELHHKQEHSVELSAVWLHHTYQEAGITPKPMVPILCGSFHHFVTNGRHPARDVRLTAVIQTLQRETQSLKVLAVASVDLAHVGPAFGDTFTMGTAGRAALRQADQTLIQTILQGDDASFYQQIAAAQDRHRICGFSSIYLLLRYLQNSSGQQIAYDQCPADQENHSLVSICGLLLD